MAKLQSCVALTLFAETGNILHIPCPTTNFALHNEIFSCCVTIEAGSHIRTPAQRPANGLRGTRCDPNDIILIKPTLAALISDFNIRRGNWVGNCFCGEYRREITGRFVIKGPKENSLYMAAKNPSGIGK